MNQEQSYYNRSCVFCFFCFNWQTLLLLHTQADLSMSCHKNVTKTKLQRDCASQPPSPLCRSKFPSLRLQSPALRSTVGLMESAEKQGCVLNLLLPSVARGTFSWSFPQPSKGILEAGSKPHPSRVQKQLSLHPSGGMAEFECWVHWENVSTWHWMVQLLFWKASCCICAAFRLIQARVTKTEHDVCSSKGWEQEKGQDKVLCISWENATQELFNPESSQTLVSSLSINTVVRHPQPETWNGTYLLCF